MDRRREEAANTEAILPRPRLLASRSSVAAPEQEFHWQTFGRYERMLCGMGYEMGSMAPWDD
jgi:hypothetical protein